MDLAKTMEKYKGLYNEEVENNRGKTKYDERQKRHVVVRAKWGFHTEAVREFYADLKDALNVNPDFQQGIKVATRAFEGIAELRDPASCSTKKPRPFGGRRKCKAPEIALHYSLWFVDVRDTLKGCLPRSQELKAKQLYNECLVQDPTEPENQLKFGNKWIQD